MEKMQKDVMAFIRGTENPVADQPGEFVDVGLCLRLIKEEVQRELIPALEQRNVVMAIDGAVDSIYVILFAMCKMGIDLEPFWDEVQRTNMAKLPVVKDEHGKTMKPPGWKAPRIKEILHLMNNSSVHVLKNNFTMCGFRWLDTQFGPASHTWVYESDFRAIVPPAERCAGCSEALGLTEVTP